MARPRILSDDDGRRWEFPLDAAAFARVLADTGVDLRWPGGAFWCSVEDEDPETLRPLIFAIIGPQADASPPASLPDIVEALVVAAAKALNDMHVGEMSPTERAEWERIADRRNEKRDRAVAAREAALNRDGLGDRIRELMRNRKRVRRNARKAT